MRYVCICDIEAEGSQKVLISQRAFALLHDYTQAEGFEDYLTAMVTKD